MRNRKLKKLIRKVIKELEDEAWSGRADIEAEAARMSPEALDGGVDVIPQSERPAEI